MQTLTRWRGAGATAASVQRGCKKNIKMNINICQYRINALKEELTQKWKLIHYVLTRVLVESWIRLRTQDECFKMEKVNSEKNMKWLQTARLA